MKRTVDCSVQLQPGTQHNKIKPAKTKSKSLKEPRRYWLKVQTGVLPSAWAVVMVPPRAAHPRGQGTSFASSPQGVARLRFSALDEGEWQVWACGEWDVLVGEISFSIKSACCWLQPRQRADTQQTLLSTEEENENSTPFNNCAGAAWWLS